MYKYRFKQRALVHHASLEIKIYIASKAQLLQRIEGSVRSIVAAMVLHKEA